MFGSVAALVALSFAGNRTRSWLIFAHAERTACTPPPPRYYSPDAVLGRSLVGVWQCILALSLSQLISYPRQSMTCRFAGYVSTAAHQAADIQHVDS